LPLLSSVILAAGCTVNTPATPPPSGSSVAAPCAQPVQTGPLPAWARAGFTGDASMPHVIGAHGEIVAAIFGHPLAVDKPADGPANKILWVAKTPSGPGEAGDLVIGAKLHGTEVSVDRRVTGGPGPSIIDLPQPGCWRLTLTWPGHTDTVDLAYR
jgi:hypothetical protein